MFAVHFFTMCGISVAINKNNNRVSAGLIESMSIKVIHRGPDDEGYYFGDNFALGHRRLSIIDLSKDGHQPMEKDGLVITFNGEIYNYIELRDELLSLGHHFASSSDTEVILVAYQQWGVGAFTKFNGMWAFAINDLRKKEIIFCRDHFGIKPLYLLETKNFFLAGSEIKQFMDADDFVPKLNKKVALNFLIHGWLNYSDETFFEEVNELGAGHYMKYNLQTHDRETVQWYDITKSSRPIKDTYSEAVDKVRELFVDSVRLRMRSDVPVGSCLSGGIDSSSIVSIIKSQNFNHSNFETITSCFNYPKYDEQTYSDAIAEQTGFVNRKIYAELDQLLIDDDINRMIYHQDQPFGGGSHYSEFCVFKDAHFQNLKVMQSGQGSDEFLCGYDEFFYVYVIELMKSLKFTRIISLLKQQADHRGTSLKHEIISFIKAKYFHSFVKGMKKVLGMKNFGWLSKDWQIKARESRKNFERLSIRGLSMTQILQSSLPYQLHSEDRNSMMFSVESRLPFLDFRLVEYCIGLPSNYKIRGGWTKAVLRDAITELPEKIRNRKHKMGFMFPDAEWMQANPSLIRNELEKAIEETKIFDKHLLQRFDRFVEDDLGYEPIYFRAIAMGRFCKIFKIKIE
jgi:asparagine synthase (glutamine-hydrolysing)